MMQNNLTANSPLRPFIPAGYLLAFLAVTLPFVDTALNWGSIQPSTAAWRFGAIGSLATAALLPMAGVVLAFCIAHAAEHLIMQRVLQVMSGVAAIAIALFMGLFTLDALEMRALVSGGIRRFDFAVLRALAGQALLLAMLAFLTYVSMRQSKVIVRSRAGCKAAGATPPQVAAIR
jgi:hypothetical protein